MGRLIDEDSAIDKITKRLFETAFNNVGIKQNIDETLVDVAENRLENWFNELPSIQQDIIRCKDCKWWTKQENSIQGRCALHKMYPSGNWYCGTARRRGEQEE